MPTIRLTTGQWAAALDVDLPTGGSLSVPRPQFRCFVRFPNAFWPRDAIIDTGAPLTFIPYEVWRPFRLGVDYEWLPFTAATPHPTGRMAGWQFTFRVAQFLAPLVLSDYSTEVERPDVIAAFALNGPPVPAGRQSLPPIVVGLWGGILEGGQIAVARDSAGRAVGDLVFP